MIHVWAEAGSCHDGDLAKARALVDVAAAAGATGIKFQYWSNADRLADRRHVPAVYRELYRRYALPREWLTTLSHDAHAKGLEFLCTAYLPEDVAVVAPYVDRLKIASFELRDEALFSACRDVTPKRPLVVSTGMATDVEVAIMLDRAFRAAGDDLTALACVSAYPAPVEALNLRWIDWLAKRLEWELPFHGPQVMNARAGFSDHTGRISTGAWAVLSGAEALEVHVRLPESDPSNPDYGHALDPHDLADYIVEARLAEQAMGTGVKNVHNSEQEMAQYIVRGDA